MARASTLQHVPVAVQTRQGLRAAIRAKQWKRIKNMQFPPTAKGGQPCRLARRDMAQQAARREWKSLSATLRAEREAKARKGEHHA
jgi:hypothetical protein